MSLSIPTPSTVYGYDADYKERYARAREGFISLLSNPRTISTSLRFHEGGFAYFVEYPNNPHSANHQLMDRQIADDLVVELRDSGWEGATVRDSADVNFHTDSFLFILPRKEESIPPEVLRRIKPAVIYPWDLSDLIVARVTKEEVLVLLRNRINNGYMPTSTGRVEFNSKPEYEDFPISEWLKPGKEGFYVGSGYYCGSDRKDIYVGLHVGQFIVVCQLNTEKVWVKVSGGDYHEWTDQTVPLNRNILEDVVDTYL